MKFGNVVIIGYIYILGCVSTTSLKEEQSKYKKVIQPTSKISNYSVYFPDTYENPCLNEDQLDFLKKNIQQYFLISPEDEVLVVFSYSKTAYEILEAPNLLVSMLTLTLIPIYISGNYEIQIFIKTANGKTSEYISNFTANGFVTILALPFVESYDFFEARRAKIENAIYQASLFKQEKNDSYVFKEKMKVHVCDSNNKFFGSSLRF